MIPGDLFHHKYPGTCMIKIQMKILSNGCKTILLKDHLQRSYDFDSVKFVIMKFIWLRGFNRMVHVIFTIGKTTPCWDQINKIISPFIAKVVLNNLFDTNIKSSKSATLLIFAAWDRDVGIQYQIYLICIFVVKGSQPSKDSKVTWKRDTWDFPLCLECGYISARSPND